MCIAAIINISNSRLANVAVARVMAYGFLCLPVLRRTGRTPPIYIPWGQKSTGNVKVEANVYAAPLGPCICWTLVWSTVRLSSLFDVTFLRYIYIVFFSRPYGNDSEFMCYVGRIGVIGRNFFSSFFLLLIVFVFTRIRPNCLHGASEIYDRVDKYGDIVIIWDNRWLIDWSRAQQTHGCRCENGQKSSFNKIGVRFIIFFRRRCAFWAYQLINSQVETNVLLFASKQEIAS